MLFSYEGFGTQLKDYGLFLIAAMISVGQYVARVRFTADDLNHKAIFNVTETNIYEGETAMSPASWLARNRQWYKQFPLKRSLFQRSYQ